MRPAVLKIRVPLTMAIAALSVTAVMASSSRSAAASSSIQDRNNTSAVDRDVHRGRDRNIVVFDDFDVSPFWDPAWDWYPPYGYPYGPGSNYARAVHKGLAPIELHVHPWKASVIVEGNTLGQARDYNDDSHPLWLTPGRHMAELQYPGYQTLMIQIPAEKGLLRNLHYRLTKGEGLDPRSQAADVPAGGSSQHSG